MSCAPRSVRVGAVHVREYIVCVCVCVCVNWRSVMCMRFVRSSLLNAI